MLKLPGKKFHVGVSPCCFSQVLTGLEQLVNINSFKKNDHIEIGVKTEDLSFPSQSELCRDVKQLIIKFYAYYIEI